MNARRRRGEEGISSVEVVILVPVLAVVILVAVAFGNAAGVRSDLANAVNAAARAGSLQRSYTAALAAAAQVLDEDLPGECDGGVHPQWPSAASFTPGGDFVITVTCASPLMGLPGMPADVTLHAIGVSPIDRFRGLT